MNRIAPPPLSSQDIIKQAEDMMLDFAIDYCKNLDNARTWFCPDFDIIYENYIYPHWGINLIDDEDLGYDKLGTKILGVTFPKTNTVYIDKSLRVANKDPRRTFTYWHEAGGHALLQGDWLREQFKQEPKSSLVVTTEAELDLNTINILERQANLFAAHAAAPSWLLRYVVESRLELTQPIRYIGPSEYCIGGKNVIYGYCHSPVDVARLMARHIQYRFSGLSLEALSYRIVKEGYIADVSTATGPSFHRLSRASRHGHVGGHQPTHVGQVNLRWLAQRVPLGAFVQK